MCANTLLASLITLYESITYFPVCVLPASSSARAQEDLPKTSSAIPPSTIWLANVAATEDCVMPSTAWELLERKVAKCLESSASKSPYFAIATFAILFATEPSNTSDNGSVVLIFIFLPFGNSIIFSTSWNPRSLFLSAALIDSAGFFLIKLRNLPLSIPCVCLLAVYACNVLLNLWPLPLKILINSSGPSTKAPTVKLSKAFFAPTLGSNTKPVQPVWITRIAEL